MPKFQPGTGKFQSYVADLLAGEKVVIYDIPRNQITGNLGSYAAIKGKYTVRTRAQGDGWLTWLDPKEPKPLKEHPVTELVEPTEPLAMPVPPNPRWNPVDSGKYGPALAELIKGHVIRVEGSDSSKVVPGLIRGWIKDQGFIIRSRNVDNDCVVWIAKR